MPKSKGLKSTFGRASVSNNAPTERVAQQGKGSKVNIWATRQNTNATYTGNNTQQAANVQANSQLLMWHMSLQENLMIKHYLKM